MNQDAIINLILKTGDSQRVMDALSKSTANYKALIAELPAQLAQGKITTEQFVEEVAKLTREHDKQARQLDQLTAAQRAAALAGDAWEQAMLDVEKAAEKAHTTTTRLSKSTETAGGSSKNLSMAMLETGRVIQDVTQGGFAGGLNNIERLTQSLAGAAGISMAGASTLAGAFTVAGVAAYTAVPLVHQFYVGLTQGSNAVPEASDKLQRLNDELKKGSDRLEELKKQQRLTNDELVEFNRLTSEATDLEKQRDEEKAKRDRVDRALNAPSEAQADRGQAFAKAVAGKGPEVLAQIEKAMEREAQLQVNTEQARLNRRAEAMKGDLAGGRITLEQFQASIDKMVAEFDDFRKTTLSGSGQNARDLFSSLLLGDARAGQRFEGLATGGFGANLGAVRSQFYSETQEGKLVDALNKAGKENEAAYREDSEKEAKKDAKEEARQDKILDRQALKDAKRLAAIGPGRKEFKATEVANAEAEKKNEAFLDKSNREGQKSFRDRRDDAIKTLSEGSLDEQAALAAAQYRAQGGVMGRNGRVTKTDETGQLSALAEDLLQRLVVMMPNASDTMRKDVASHMAANAFSSVDEQVQAQQAQLLGGMNGNMNVAQKTQMTVAANQQALAAVLDRLRALEAQADAQLQQALDLRSQTRTAQRRGR